MLMYSVEISIDGFSTRLTPRHNIIIHSNGRSFYIGSLETGSSSANAAYISSLISFTLSRIESLVNDKVDDTLIGVVTTLPIVEFAKKVVWLSLDGASANVSGVQFAEVQNSSFVLLHSHCFTHSMNLLLKDFMDESWIAALLAPTKILLSVFKNQHITTAWLKEEGGLKLRSYPITRFGYLLLVFHRFLKNRIAFEKVIRSQRYKTLLAKAKSHSKKKITSLL
ncbi:hypothetical protein RCL1_001214 [Eukaryota sp. TZLM3-RCL]